VGNLTTQRDGPGWVMLAQICFLYAELAALFLGAGAIICQLMGPASVGLCRDEYCG